jgi:hypothetical protein
MVTALSLAAFVADCLTPTQQASAREPKPGPDQHRGATGCDPGEYEEVLRHPRLGIDPKTKTVTVANHPDDNIFLECPKSPNTITEGFHTKMEVLQRQASGFRNFQNYRLRVRVMCC